MSNRPRTTVYTSPEQLLVLRQLAAALGLVQTRGVGYGTAGSLSRLLDIIATSYTANPATVKLYFAAMKTDWEAGQAAD